MAPVDSRGDELAKRPLPDYDGRPDAPPSAGQVTAWIPRVILFPAWVATEFVIRQPLGWLVTSAEKGNWPSEILSFFTFGEAQNWGIVPTFYVDLGFRPNAGLYVFWDKALHPAHSIRFRAAGWIDSFTASFADRWQTDRRGSRFELRGQVSLRPDRLFWGIGPRSLEEEKARFGELRWVGSGSFELRGGYGEMVRLEAGVRSVAFREGTCCSGPTVEDNVAAGVYASPPGLTEGGYGAFYQRLSASADSRPPRPGNQTGVRIAVDTEHGSTFEDDGWLRLRGTAGVFWDVADTDRVLGLTLTTAFAHATRGEVPFTELVDLAGQEVLQGLRPGRLRGESAIAASLRYEWPIWAALGGTLQLDLGNVFDEWLEGFDAELLRLSFGFGVRTLGSGDHGLQLLLGVGTETFADGTDLTSVRFAIGGTYGF